PPSALLQSRMYSSADPELLLEEHAVTAIRAARMYKRCIRALLSVRLIWWAQKQRRPETPRAGPMKSLTEIGDRRKQGFRAPCDLPRRPGSPCCYPALR